MNPEIVTALIHLDPDAAGQATLDGHFAEAGGDRDPMQGLRWYLDYLSEHSAHAFFLLPERCRNDASSKDPSLRTNPVLWYGDDGTWKLPKDASIERVWLINGERLPIVNWSTAGASADRIDADILVFDPSAPSRDRHYSESVLVDATGAVTQVRRNYDDSPTFTDLWSGQASFLMTGARLAVPVVSHVLMRGWGLDSIGSLTRRFTVRWSEAPSALSGARSRRVITGPLRTPVRTSPKTRANSSGPALEHADRQASPDRQKAAAPASQRGTGGGTLDPPRKASIPALTKERPDTLGSSDDRDDSAPDQRPIAYLVIKRTMDVAASGVGLLLLSPLLLVVAALVKLTSRGPVFFAHTRQGLAGKPFACLKFRSMTVDADAMQAKLRAQNEVDGPQFKIAADPRVTALGTWLRRLNLDELPQLINVFLGQMSLVGPRPSPDAENQVCPPWRRARLSVKPGITGLWQVLRTRDRPDTDFQEWIYYDVEYARHRCLWLDVWTILYTPVSMFAPGHLVRFVRKLERRGICLASDRRMST